MIGALLEWPGASTVVVRHPLARKPHARQDDRRARRNWCTASPLWAAEGATVGSTKLTGTQESDPSTMLGLVVLVVVGLLAAIAVGVVLGVVVG
ncbi:hypothetical protein [Gaiella sp.]|uniref:hypothetical protein n=1 Tax=Gaiella sp. TaxID=2663207 RepID=UPI002D80DF26|nr:hypothetical protein [Gaiella sp.]